MPPIASDAPTPGAALIGARLREARTASGFGVRELSRRIGVTASMVSQMERGTVMPSVATLRLIVRELDVSLDELFATGVTVPRPAPRGEAATPPAPQPGEEAVGARLRALREDRGLGVRELSRRVGVSASMISQIELDRVMPSVATLYAIVAGLDASLDDVVFATTGARARPRPAPVQVRRRGEHRSHSPAEGVRCELLPAAHDPHVELMLTTYAPGAEWAGPDPPRRGGSQHGWVLGGRLSVTVGDETLQMRRGDSISLDPATPHRLLNPGDEQAQVMWVVVAGDV